MEKKYDVFISYSNYENEFVKTVATYLERYGISCWVTFRDNPTGEEATDATIRNAIKDSRAFLKFVFNRSYIPKQINLESRLAWSSCEQIVTYGINDIPGVILEKEPTVKQMDEIVERIISALPDKRSNTEEIRTQEAEQKRREREEFFRNAKEKQRQLEEETERKLAENKKRFKESTRTTEEVESRLDETSRKIEEPENRPEETSKKIKQIESSRKGSPVQTDMFNIFMKTLNEIDQKRQERDQQDTNNESTLQSEEKETSSSINKQKPFEVFISYSQQDVEVALKVKAALEQNDIRSWIAADNIPVGTEYAAAIEDALEECTIFVLILSKHSNGSVHVKNEIDLAVNNGMSILTLRIEDVELAKGMRYYLQRRHWLEALTEPREKEIQQLVQSIKVLKES